MDVFQDHNGVVNDDADGEHHAQHGEIVEGIIHRPHQRERGDERSGDGDGGDHGPPPVVQEKEDRQRDQHRAHHQVKTDLVQRAFDEARLVANDGHREIRRNHRRQFPEFGFDRLDHLDGVGSGLLAHDECRRIHAVES